MQYKKGTENRVVDALSRRQDQESTLLSISTVQPTWLQEIGHSYEDDPISLALLGELAATSGSNSDYSLQQGVIRSKQSMWEE